MAAQPAVQDKFLKGGVRMSNGFVATTICCPSRTETFTGRHLHNLFGGTSCMWADTSLAGGRTTGLFGRVTDLGYVTGVRETRPRSELQPHCPGCCATLQMTQQMAQQMTRQACGAWTLFEMRFVLRLVLAVC